ncbi:MAG: hypothetical protein AAGF12_15870 [Myxococcota bacterium]
MRRVLSAICVLASLSACDSEPTDETPAGALTLFLRAMDRSERDAAGLRDAYELLDRESRAALQERADLANSSGVSGRRFQPWEMLVRGRFHLRFVPRSEDGIREIIEEGQARVIVTGNRDGQRADIPMVREDGRWKVVLNLPPLLDE